jgi:hypothetical protein
MPTPTPPRRELSMLAAIGLALLITSGCVTVATVVLNFAVFSR